MIDYSLKFKKLREFLNLTQQQFAENIGISRAVLSQIEIRNQKPTLETINAIAKKYSIPYDYFFIENIEPGNKTSKTVKKTDTVNEQILDYGYMNLEKILNNLPDNIDPGNKLNVIFEYIIKEINQLKKEIKKLKSGYKSEKKN